MRPGAIVVPGVRGKDPAELPLVEDHHVVQTLSAQGANESLRIAVGSVPLLVDFQCSLPSRRVDLELRSAYHDLGSFFGVN